MIGNYIHTAARVMWRHKLYAGINVLGLAIGLAACLLILLFVRFETSYDTMWSRGDQIFRVATTYTVPGRDPMRVASSPMPAAEGMKLGIESIVDTMRIVPNTEQFKRGGEVVNESVYYVDANFFTFFDLKPVEGTLDGALDNPNSAVLSVTAAERLFPGESALGKTLTPNDFGASPDGSGPISGWADVQVVAVVEDLPDNTHLKLANGPTVQPGEVWMSFEAPSHDFNPGFVNFWGAATVYTYVLTREGVDEALLTKDLETWVANSVPALTIIGQTIQAKDFISLTPQPLRSIHLDTRWAGTISVPTDTTLMSAFLGIAILILVIASINFMNLATARASLRAREVGLRKTFGALRSQLIVQHTVEGVLVTLIALFLALCFVELSLTGFNALLQRELDIGYWDEPMITLGVIGAVCLIGALSGLYPAFVLSSFRPVTVLKASAPQSSGGFGGVRFLLVVVQFAVSVGLMIATAVVFAQTTYARSIDLGFNSDNLLFVFGTNVPPVNQQKDVLEQRVKQHPGVRDATFSSFVPTLANEANVIVKQPGSTSTEPTIIRQMNVALDFFDVYGVPVVAGRSFSEDYPTDISVLPNGQNPGRGGAAMLNEAAIARLGYASAEDALGKQLIIPAGQGGQENTLTIVGIVSDFHMQSIRIPIYPTIYFVIPQGHGTMTVRLTGQDVGGALRHIEDIWRDMAPEVPFASAFFDTTFANQYQQEESQGRLFAGFAGLAVFVACLGLFGLAAFTAERRTKEIGIRKVLGARISDIVTLLLRQFSVPVVIGNLLAWPIAGYLMIDWLSGFAYRLPDYTVAVAAVLAGALSLAIAWITVIAHAYRVARANPGRALRYE